MAGLEAALCKVRRQLALHNSDTRRVKWSETANQYGVAVKTLRDHAGVSGKPPPRSVGAGRPTSWQLAFQQNPKVLANSEKTRQPRGRSWRRQRRARQLVRQPRRQQRHHAAAAQQHSRHSRLQQAQQLPSSSCPPPLSVLAGWGQVA